MKDLTLITEPEEYEPGYSNPETTAGSNPSETGEIKPVKMIFAPTGKEEGVLPEVKVGELEHLILRTPSGKKIVVRGLQKPHGFQVWAAHNQPGGFGQGVWAGVRDEVVHDTALGLDVGAPPKSELSSNPGEPLHESTPGFSNFHSLMLHAVADMYGDGGIVVDEVKAKATPCHCVEYKPDKFWCTSPGIIGALTDKQEGLYCNPRELVERPGIKERMEKWQACVTKSREAMPPTDGRGRLEIFLNSMSKCLKESGVEA